MTRLTSSMSMLWQPLPRFWVLLPTILLLISLLASQSNVLLVAGFTPSTSCNCHFERFAADSAATVKTLVSRKSRHAPSMMALQSTASNSNDQDSSSSSSIPHNDTMSGATTAATSTSATFVLDFPVEVADSDCPPGYFLDSVEQSCHKLGPLGTFSQKMETSFLRRQYDAISNLFGLLDKQRQGLSRLGVGFGLAYAILSTLNGSITLSVAWYLSAKRTGLSPLAPGQWKNLLAAYGTLYAFVQVLKPFRVAAAIAMSKLCKQGLDATQEYYHCSRRTAMAVQYGLGWLAWFVMTVVGVGLASLRTGTPIFG